MIVQHSTYSGMYILKNKKPVMDDTILIENDNSIAIIAVHTSGSNSQALAAILSQCASQSNRLATLQKKESPLGQPLQLLWTLHHGGVLNAGKDCLFGKLFRRGPVKTVRGGKYLHEQSSFYTSQKV